MQIKTSFKARRKCCPTCSAVVVTTPNPEKIKCSNSGCKWTGPVHLRRYIPKSKKNIKVTDVIKKTATEELKYLLADRGHSIKPPARQVIPTTQKKAKKRAMQRKAEAYEAQKLLFQQTGIKPTVNQKPVTAVFEQTEKSKPQKNKPKRNIDQKTAPEKFTVAKGPYLNHHAIEKANRDEKKRFAKLKELQQKEAKPRP